MPMQTHAHPVFVYYYLVVLILISTAGKAQQRVYRPDELLYLKQMCLANSVQLFIECHVNKIAQLKASQGIIGIVSFVNCLLKV